MSQLVKIKDTGHVRTITLNRADKKNALSTELAWGVIEAVDAAVKDDNVWVVAITGSGDAFCAGLDLSGGERYSPHSPQITQLDDVSWVGNFLSPSPSAAISRWSVGSMGWPWVQALALPWQQMYVLWPEAPD